MKAPYCIRLRLRSASDLPACLRSRLCVWSPGFSHFSDSHFGSGAYPGWLQCRPLAFAVGGANRGGGGGRGGRGGGGGGGRGRGGGRGGGNFQSRVPSNRGGDNRFRGGVGGESARGGSRDDFLQRYLEGGGAAENATDKDFAARFLPTYGGDRDNKQDRGNWRFSGGQEAGGYRGGGRRSSRGGAVSRFGGDEDDNRPRRSRGAARFMENSEDEDNAWSGGRQTTGDAIEGQDDDREQEEEDEGQEDEQAGKRKSMSMYAGRIFERHDHTLRRGFQKQKRYQPEESEESEVEEEDADESEEEVPVPVPIGEASDDDEVEVADEEEFEKVMQKLREKRPEEVGEMEKDRKVMRELRKNFPRLMEELREEEEEYEQQDYAIPRIVFATEKEEMWKLHKENPQENPVEKLAEKYRICKARVHAILWLWELRKQGGEELMSPEQEDKEFRSNLAFNSDGEDEPAVFDVNLQREDKWETMWGTKPNYKIMPEDWEGSVRTEKEVIEEVSRKEEEMMLTEFEQRMEFNKLQIAGFIKSHIYSRRRPVNGWSYIVEELGEQGKRGKRGGHKFVANSDGTHRPLNDLEKIFLRREAVRPRRRIV